MYILQKTQHGVLIDISAHDSLERLIRAAQHYTELHGIESLTVRETDDLDDVCTLAVNTYGADAQEWVFVGEIGELLDALADYKRGRCGVDHIAEEIADVEITLEQIKIIYDCRDAVSEWQHKHLDKLRRKIEHRADGSSRTPTPANGGMTF